MKNEYHLNMTNNQRFTTNLHGLAKFSLFVSSYTPLFTLIILKQIFENYQSLYWGGISLESLSIFASKFGLTVLLGLLSILGIIGLYITFGNIKNSAKNGIPVKVTNVSNRNSEAIGYIATYILPFLFQSLNGWYELLSILFILFIVYKIYTNSSMLLINPLLNCFYSIYEIQYNENNKTRTGLIIYENKYLYDDSQIKIYEIGYKLYFAIDNNLKN